MIRNIRWSRKTARGELYLPIQLKWKDTNDCQLVVPQSIHTFISILPFNIVHVLFLLFVLLLLVYLLSLLPFLWFFLCCHFFIFLLPVLLLIKLYIQLSHLSFILKFLNAVFVRLCLSCPILLLLLSFCAI